MEEQCLQLYLRLEANSQNLQRNVNQKLGKSHEQTVLKEDTNS